MLKQTITMGITVAVIFSFLTACSQDGGRDGGIKKQHIGALGGAIAGAWVGSNVGKGKGKIVGTALGTLLGAYAGSEIGASLDRADMAYHNETAQIAFETFKTGETKEWVNPDSGNRGSITPTRTYETASGSYCREYSQTITVGQKTENAYGTACRQPDGSWKITN